MVRCTLLRRMPALLESKLSNFAIFCAVFKYAVLISFVVYKA